MAALPSVSSDFDGIAVDDALEAAAGLWDFDFPFLRNHVGRRILRDRQNPRARDFNAPKEFSRRKPECVLVAVLG